MTWLDAISERWSAATSIWPDTEGLPNAAVCIGDCYQIGSGLFEVTQPRVTCYRIDIRMDEHRV